MNALTSTTKLGQVSTVKEMLSNQHAFKQLEAVAASHLNPERMMRTLALAVSKTPKLAECTPLSLLGALMTSASLGLEPNNVLGLSYLVPFENRRAKTVEAQLIIGYRGYIQLGLNSGQLAGAPTAAIHYNDDPHWLWRMGSNDALEHSQGDMQGKMLHAYAKYRLKGSDYSTWVVWTESQLVAHRDRYSKGYANDIKYGKKATDANVNIWLADPALARMKTMIRQLAKVMPMSSEAPQAAALDGARANYAAFAMDPQMGLPAPEAEGSEVEANDETGLIEGEVAEDAGAVVETPVDSVEHLAPVETKPDAKAAAAAAAAKVRAAAQAKEPEASAEQQPKTDWTVPAAQIRREIGSAAPEDVNSILDLWDDKLTPMKAEAREVYDDLLEFAARRENGGS